MSYPISTIRHSLAHVMALAVKNLFGDVKFAIGPDIESGFYYDFDMEHRITENDFANIESEMKKIIKSDGRFVKEVLSKQDALNLFADQPYKIDLIENLPANEEISIYKLREFTDLCRGPHVESTKDLPRDSFKLDKIAGAYWRGDSKNKMLQRIYALAFSSKEELDVFLVQREEAEKRDHRKLGPALDLFHFEPEYAPGAIFWHDKGYTLYRTLIEFMREKQQEAGYVEIETPRVMDRVLWETSGHWEKYGAMNYSGQTEDEKMFCIKPMNCPGGLLVYNKGIKSYKDLPILMAEFGKVNRFEASGSLHGLLRVREFTQDDAHIFCTESQLEEECIKVVKFIFDIYKVFGFDKIDIKLSTRPEERIGDDSIWDLSEKVLFDVLKNNGYEFEIQEGEGAFYGPKLEFHIKDAIGRGWQLGTLQLDMNLPERFDINYIAEDGTKKRPIMLHRAILGSIERFLGILIENYDGKFPVWLAPTKAVIIPISEKHIEYADKVYSELKKSGLAVEKDYSNESMQKRIRDAQLNKIPYMVLVGEKEEEQNKISIRTRENIQENGIDLKEFIDKLKTKISNRDLEI